MLLLVQDTGGIFRRSKRADFCACVLACKVARSGKRARARIPRGRRRRRLTAAPQTLKDSRSLHSIWAPLAQGSALKNAHLLIDRFRFDSFTEAGSPLGASRTRERIPP